MLKIRSLLLFFLVCAWFLPAQPAYSWTDDLAETRSGGAVQQGKLLPVKALHLNEIKSEIESAASLCGFTMSWTSAETTMLAGIQKGERIYKDQLNILRNGILTVYSHRPATTVPTSIQQSFGTYFNSRIQGSNVQDMRDAIETIKQVCSSGSVCGNNIKEPGETCDDGNTNNGDGCSSTCQTEAPTCWSSSWTTPPSSCPGGWVTGVNPEGLGPCSPSGICTQIDVNSQQVGFCDPTDPSWATCTCTGGDPIFDGCGGQTGTTPITCTGTRNTANTTYYQCIASCPAAAICGNGEIETGEECDDSNTNNGDGCSSTCQSEGNYCWEYLGGNFPSSCPAGWITPASTSGSCLPGGACAQTTENAMETGTCVPGDGLWDNCYCSSGCAGETCVGNRLVPITSYSRCTTCPPQPVCGNGTCEPSESAALCPADCATCSDGLQNQGETAVDCGGPCPACGQWYNVLGVSRDLNNRVKTCADSCNAMGRSLALDVEGGYCASGEQRPRATATNGAQNISYNYGTWRAGRVVAPMLDYVTIRGYTSTHWCYHVGQKRDSDKTDIAVACFCI